MNYHQTRHHYDHRTETPRDDREALRDRASGPCAPLKRYHNAIKRALIDTFARDASALLDVGCGRGGDIHKWVSAKIAYVRGIDVSPKEIEEARRRYAVLAPRSTHCDFAVETSFGSDGWHGDERVYDVVTCMFALHYFWESEETARAFFRNAAKVLKPGGYVIGTVPDARRVLAKCPSYANAILTITQCFEGDPQPFGSAYVCSIGDTIVASDDRTQGSLEYLVFSSVLEKVARHHGFVPCAEYTFPGSAESNSWFKHFNASYPHPDLRAASDLFAAFAFRRAV